MSQQYEKVRTHGCALPQYLIKSILIQRLRADGRAGDLRSRGRRPRTLRVRVHLQTAGSADPEKRAWTWSDWKAEFIESRGQQHLDHETT